MKNSTPAFSRLLKNLHDAMTDVMNAGRGLALGIFLWVSMPLHAHEFWLEPVAGPVAAGGSARLALRVGEFFEGELLGFSAQQTVALRQYSAAGMRDLQRLLPLRSVVATLDLPVPDPGTYLIAFDSQPNQIALSADRFHAYLHDEGLDFIKAQREANGSADKPGRERYRRHVKTLLRAAGVDPSAATPDMTWATRTGQRLEIVPLANPLALRPLDPLAVQVLFEGKPLAGALLKAWYKRDGQTLTVRATTAADGKATLTLPYAGAWMISVVHMVPAVGTRDIDWDSLWGNLSFYLSAATSASP